MKTQIITMQSITRAMQAQRELGGRGVAAQVVRLSADARAKGCAYGVEVLSGDIPRALAILSDRGVSYRAIRERDAVL